MLNQESRRNVRWMKKDVVSMQGIWKFDISAQHTWTTKENVKRKKPDTFRSIQRSTQAFDRKRAKEKNIETRIRIKMSRDMSISSCVIVGVIPSEGHTNKKDRNKVMLLQVNRYQICCRESTSTIGAFSWPRCDPFVGTLLAENMPAWSDRSILEAISAYRAESDLLFEG